MPALNWGLQFTTMEKKAVSGKLQRRDAEIVYPGVRKLSDSLISYLWNSPTLPVFCININVISLQYTMVGVG